MGTFKRDHIRAITRMPRVAQYWQQVYGREASEEDVETLYTVFTPKQIAIITDYSALIPEVQETVQALRARGIKIGSCTGFTQEMMQPLLPEVAKLWQEKILLGGMLAPETNLLAWLLPVMQEQHGEMW